MNYKERVEYTRYRQVALMAPPYPMTYWSVWSNEDGTFGRWSTRVIGMVSYIKDKYTRSKQREYDFGQPSRPASFRALDELGYRPSSEEEMDFDYLIHSADYNQPLRVGDPLLESSNACHRVFLDFEPPTDDEFKEMEDDAKIKAGYHRDQSAKPTSTNA